MSSIAPSISETDPLRSALAEANLPTLCMVLAHLTGDDRWLEGPYLPSRPRGADDNDSGGFSPEIQESIREEAWNVLCALRDGRLRPAAPPSPERIVRILSTALRTPIPPEAGPLMAEELGVVSRDVPIQRSAAVERFRVIVIGAGFSGLVASIQLAKAGIAHT